MNPSRIVLIVGGVVLALALIAAAGGAYSSSGDWAAKVDGRAISERDLLDELEQLREHPDAAQFGFPESSPGAVSSQVSSAWLARSVQNVIVELEIERRDVEVTDEHVAAAEANAVQSFGGAEAWDAFAPWFREREIRSLANLLALSEVIGGPPSEADLRAAYEAQKELLARSCTSHILVETLEEAEEIKAQLDEGGDFAALAAEHSIDTASAENGGEIGCLRRGEGLVPSYEATAFSLGVGEISDPVESEFGFHVIRVDDVQEPTFEEARPQLEQLAQGQAQQRFAEVMGQVLTEADIEVNPKYGSLDLEDPEGRFVVPPPAPTVPDSLPVGDEEPEGADLFSPVP